MDQAIRDALASSAVIDITTTGRQSGEPRRIEIFFHNIDGRLFISGMPNPKKRAWLANLEANPAMTFHLKNGVVADLPGTARVIDEPAERRVILERVAANWGRTDVDRMVQESPLVEVTLSPEMSA